MRVHKLIALDLRDHLALRPIKSGPRGSAQISGEKSGAIFVARIINREPNVRTLDGTKASPVGICCAMNTMCLHRSRDASGWEGSARGFIG